MTRLNIGVCMRKTQLIKPTEHQEAVVLAEWMRLRGIFFIHVPNEGYRSFPSGLKLKREGMTAGCPDYIILGHPTRSQGVEYDSISPPVFLELKRIGGKLSDSQSEFLERLEREGYITLVCYGADEAINELQKMGY